MAELYQGKFSGQEIDNRLDNVKRTCRFVIGTSTAGWTEADCDYLCDGTADDVEINAAIQALPGTGGQILILDGTYKITAPITVNKINVTLRGNGTATILQRNWDSSTREGVINITAMDGGVTVQNIQIRGEKQSYTNTNNIGIFLKNTQDNIITGNICNNNSSNGIYLEDTQDNSITENTCDGNYRGIYFSNSSNNIVTGNTCNNNNDGIYLSSSDNNTVTGNTCIRGTGQSSDYTSRQYTIRVQSTQSSKNLFVGNNIMGKNYTDDGTGNTWANNKYN